LVKIPVANLSKSIANLPAPERFRLRQYLDLVRVLWTEPLFRGLLPGVVRGLFAKRPKNAHHDDSIRNLVERRFGRHMADNFVSAIAHGLFAGDISKLSARALFPGLWALDTKLSEPWGLVKAIYHPKSIFTAEKWVTGEKRMLDTIRRGPAGDLEKRRFASGSVFSFKGGVSTFPDRLAEAIKQMPNVQIKLSTPISSITPNPDKVHIHVSHS
jgi:protoporphyrinogen/coproporphyrinogen III oxidase